MNLRDMTPCTDLRLLRLAVDDNVCAAITTLEVGDLIEIEGRLIRIAVRIPTGHKIAVSPIASGEAVKKYGLTIGSATQRIEPGDYVHTHNLKSNYLPTYTLSRK